MRIGLLESHIEWEDKQKNIKHLEQLFIQMKDQSVNQEEVPEIIFLPEMSFTGFSMDTKKTGEIEKETVAKLMKLSKEYQTGIGFGWVKNTNVKSENHYSIVQTGKEILDYTKIHPFSYSTEDQYFQGGDQLCLCRIEDFSVGTLICYDLRFPEIFQILSESADLIVVPANWPAKRSEHWNTLLKARAIENQCYIAGVNCVGEIGGLAYSGNSAVYNPLGEPLTPINTYQFGENNLYIYEIENDVKKYRDAFPLKQDRKEELYFILEKNKQNKM